MHVALFPLQLVLFPGSQIPLHVFEQRYKSLVADIEKSTGVFGISLLEHGELFHIGCFARLVAVQKRYSDGRCDILVEGSTRYTMNALVETPHLYSVADVEEMFDEPIPTDALLEEKCVALYNHLVAMVFGNHARTFSNSEPRHPTSSFLMAPKCGLSTAQKQDVLEMKSENDRLEFLVQHLEEIIPSIQQAETISRVVQSDGYFTPHA
jgi:ATP-dependent Lon protease